MTRRIPYFWLLMFLLAFLLLTAGGRIAPQDDETTFRMTANLIEYGRTTITEQYFTVEPQTFPGFLPHTQPRELLTTWAALGRDGQKHGVYSPGQAIVSIPLYLAGRVLNIGPLTLQGVMLTHWTTALFNPIIIALTGWLVALFASRLGYSRRLSTALGLAYGLCTMALAYASTYFGEPLIAFLIVLAAYAVYRTRDPQAHGLRWLFVAGATLALAVFIRERSAIIVPPFVLYLLLLHRRILWRGWLAFFTPLIVGALLIGLNNWGYYGSPLTFGYSALQHAAFTTPLLLGLYGLLLSPGKGLLFYNPIVWAGLVGLTVMMWRRPLEALLFVLIMVAELIFFATYEFWTGGWNWGPRYILPLVPLLVLAAGEWVYAKPTRLRKTVLIALCAIGWVLNTPALLVDHSRYLVSFGERDPQNYLDRSILRLEDSPLIQQWPAVLDMAALYARPETWAAARQAIQQHLQSYDGPSDLEALSTHVLWFDEFFRLNVPDFWFVHLPLLGFSPFIVGLLALGLLALALWSGWKVITMLR